MITDLAVLRTLSLFLPLILAFGLVYWRPPERGLSAGLFLSLCWNFVSLLMLNEILHRYGMWTYLTEGGEFFNTPVDLVLGWALLWAVPPLIVQLRLWQWLVVYILLDLLLMPRITELVELHETWLWGEALCIVAAFLPAYFLGQWTKKSTHLRERNILQMLLFGMSCFILLPATVWALRAKSFDPISLSVNSLWLAQALFFAALPSLSALQELYLRGEGTPFPMDPTKKLVTTGLYAFLSNPMQLSQFFIFIVLTVYLSSIWMLGIAIMGVIYSLGFARWQESGSMKERFGEDYYNYAKEIKPYLVCWRPYRPNAATVYLDILGCGQCAGVAKFLKARKPTALIIKDAREHIHAEKLERMVYVDHDFFEESGIKALARCFEHINFAWALFGAIMRLPLLSQLIQLLADALAPPHKLCKVNLNTQEKS